MARKANTDELADRLHSTAIHLLRLVRAQDAATGVGPARLSALSVIVFGGPVSLNDLARAEQVRPPTMSRIVDALEREGLARRRTNQQDRRAVVIEATQKGAQILKQGRQRRVKYLAGYLRRLSAAEQKQIENAVQAIQKALAR
ncbi:MAG TPA: MarR family transcriptional regulator [Candidatus Angelobacter sp.]|jgi:DNA-binding MarR family transcriptional regulator